MLLCVFPADHPDADARSINAHAEELRDTFVDHAGKKTLTIVAPNASLDNADFGDLAVKMTERIDENVGVHTFTPGSDI